MTLMGAAGVMDANQLTPEVEAAYSAEHPKTPLRTVRMALSMQARHANGNSHQPKEPPPMAIPSDMKEALLMVGSFERLNQKRAALSTQIDNLEIEIKKLDEELTHYKPILAHIRGLTQAVQAVKDSVRVKV